MKSKFFFILTLVVLSFSTTKATNFHSNNHASISMKTQDYCGVSADQIFQYMLSKGYTVTQIYPIAGSCDVIVKTTIGKRFIVYISNGIIIGYDDVIE